jgi:hypothetical protein
MSNLTPALYLPSQAMGAVQPAQMEITPPTHIEVPETVVHTQGVRREIYDANNRYSSFN